MSDANRTTATTAAATAPPPPASQRAAATRAPQLPLAVPKQMKQRPRQEAPPPSMPPSPTPSPLHHQEIRRHRRRPKSHQPRLEDSRRRSRKRTGPRRVQRRRSGNPSRDAFSFCGAWRTHPRSGVVALANSWPAGARACRRQLTERSTRRTQVSESRTSFSPGEASTGVQPTPPAVPFSFSSSAMWRSERRGRLTQE